jgi:hypothetical protein
MDKAELAQYLVNLQTLMDSQAATGNLASSTLREEYERQWGKLKEEIKKDEARTEHEQDRRPETGTEQPRGQPLRRG